MALLLFYFVTNKIEIPACSRAGVVIFLTEVTPLQASFGK
jgi:hypothetical protein